MCRNNSFEVLVLVLVLVFNVSSFAMKVSRKGKMLKGRLNNSLEEPPRLLPHRDEVGEVNTYLFVSMIFSQSVSLP